jgi:membrane protein implicated in regulation of membrane protease activity
VAIVLAMAEIGLGTYYLLALAIAALVTAMAAWLGVDSLWYQLLIMAVCSLASMFYVPKWLQRINRKTDGFANENVRVVGMQGTVIRDISSAHNGVVKLENGAEWTAKSDQPLQVGDAVVITEQIGSIAVVRAKHPGPNADPNS